MAMTYRFEMTCGGCNTAIRFEDERPDWKTYDYRIEQSDECERAARFVAEFADIDQDAPGSTATIQNGWEAAGEPAFIQTRRVWPEFSHRPTMADSKARLELAIPPSYRYIECPVCDARVVEPRSPHGGLT